MKKSYVRRAAKPPLASIFREGRVALRANGFRMGQVTAGKVRAIGLSAVGPDLLRRAAAVAPISALQSEYSLWAREVEQKVLPACRELCITFVPYSPLGRAALTGRFTSDTSFSGDDFRSTLPKFQGENFAENLRVVEELKAFAEKRGHAPGQIALAWLLAQPYDITPIPRTRRAAYARQNAAATAVPLSADDVAFLADLFDPARVRGGQYGTLNVRPHPAHPPEQHAIEESP